MSATPREIGTLIVVILRANHLPNKRHIGKQDPYCIVVLNGEKRRTKAIKRGGQHPEWDEELRFTLFEDVDDVLARTAKGDGTPPAPPPKDDKKPRRVKGGKMMKLACYADDPREPDFIGEADVDLTEVLTKGETDEWFTLMNKDKFAGKVYLELTFWSNEPPPEKKPTPKPPRNNKQYAGPGSFVPLDNSPASGAHSRQSSDVVPSSLRASNPYANVDLYVAPYERNRQSQMDNLTQNFGEFGVSEPRRRESFPPVANPYITPTRPHPGSSTMSTYGGYGYDHSQDPNAYYPYDTSTSPMDPHGAGHYQHPSNGTIQGYSTQSYTQSVYDVPSPTATYQPPARGPRHSVPAASSGFMPLNQQTSFIHQSEPSGFMPVSHTPAPMNYGSQFHFQTNQQPYPPSAPTPAPPTVSYLPPSTSMPYQSQSPAQPYGYPSYGLHTSVSAPLQQFVTSPPPQTPLPPPSNSAPPQVYAASPLQDNMHITLSNGQTSRPLPQQPQIVYAQQALPPQPVSQPSNGYSPTPASNTYPQENNYGVVPPPPPPPPSVQYNTNPNGVIAPASGPPLPVPPPPPPPNIGSHRRPSLPPTPAVYQAPTYQQPPPPPPPPPIATGEFYSSNTPLPPPPPPLQSMNGHHPYTGGVLPQPPAPVNEYGQWTQSPNSSAMHTTQAY